MRRDQRNTKRVRVLNPVQHPPPDRLVIYLVTSPGHPAILFSLPRESCGPCCPRSTPLRPVNGDLDGKTDGCGGDLSTDVPSCGSTSYRLEDTATPPSPGSVPLRCGDAAYCTTIVRRGETLGKREFFTCASNAELMRP